MLAHEVDRFGRHHLRRHDEVAFVLAILVVEHDHHLPGADLGNGRFDRVARAVALGQPLADRGEDPPQALERPVRGLPTPRAQQGDGRLGQVGAFGDLGRRQARGLHRSVQQFREVPHPSSLRQSLQMSSSLGRFGRPAHT